jgi:CBS domain-containing protein
MLLETTALMTEIPTHVRDLMQGEVVTLKGDDHLDLANDIMRLGRIRHMPVVSANRLVGVLSQRDLFRAAVSSVLTFPPKVEREWLAKIRVDEVMVAPAVAARPEWPILRAVETMLDKKIGCLPVVDDDELVGLLSETDCLHLLARILRGGPAESIRDEG